MYKTAHLAVVEPSEDGQKRSIVNSECAIVPPESDDVASQLDVARADWLRARDARALRRALLEVLTQLDE